MTVSLLTTRGGQRTLEGPPTLCVNSTDCWICSVKYETTGVTGVFTEQFMGSPNSYLLRNERKTLANIYIECARMQSCFWLLQTLLVAALPPSTFLHRIFPFPGPHQFPGSSHSQPHPGPNQGGHHSTRGIKTTGPLSIPVPHHPSR